jgi:hypothetical protein
VLSSVLSFTGLFQLPEGFIARLIKKLS